MNNKKLKKQKNIYLLLMVAPLPVLIASSVLNVFVVFVFGLDGGIIDTVLNIFMMLLGIAAVICLLLLPVWIIRYISVTKQLDQHQ